jgi:hypothetical protein
MSSVEERVVFAQPGPGAVEGRTDLLVHERVLGGPAVPLDTRLILSRADLEALLVVASASLTGRVVVERVGLRVRVWQTSGGHRYETWTLLGAQAKPERAPFLRPAARG